MTDKSHSRRRKQKDLVMEYMIRFTQVHETFRLAEIEALAVLEGIDLTIVSYKPDVSRKSLVPSWLLLIVFSYRFASSNYHLWRLPSDWFKEAF